MNFKLLIILIYFIIFSLTFTFTTPVFEGTDENHHLAYINYVSVYKQLPNQFADRTDSLKYVVEGHQPPLYYIIASGINILFNGGNPVIVNSKINPDNERYGGKAARTSLFLNLRDDVFTDFHSKLSFYALRILSLLFSIISIIYIYKSAFLIYKKSIYTYIATMVAAGLPQFAFISGVINNSSLFIMFSTIAFYIFLMILKDPTVLKNYFLCGIIIGLGILTSKITLFLYPFAFFIFLYLSVTEKYDLGKIGRNISVMLIVSFVVGSFYFIRNYIAYGEIFGSQMEYNTLNYYIAPNSIFSKFLLSKILPGLYHSFIGSFGWMNVKLPFIIYGAFTALFILAGMGFLLYFRKDSDDKFFIYFAFLFFIANLFTIFYINLTFLVYQGRFLLPSLGALSLLISGSIRNLITTTPHLSYAYKPIFEIKTEKKEKLTIILMAVGFIVVDFVSVYTNYNFYL